MFGFQSRAVEDCELDHLRQLTKPVPGREPRDVVFSDEADKLRAGFTGAKRFDGLDRVGGRRALQLQRIETKSRLALDGSAQHFDAKVSRCRRPFEFMRRHRCRNEEQLIELELFNRVTGQN